jgi:hypothetical protein
MVKKTVAWSTVMATAPAAPVRRWDPGPPPSWRPLIITITRALGCSNLGVLRLSESPKRLHEPIENNGYDLLIHHFDVVHGHGDGHLAVAQTLNIAYGRFRSSGQLSPRPLLGDDRLQSPQKCPKTPASRTRCSLPRLPSATNLMNHPPRKARFWQRLRNWRHGFKDKEDPTVVSEDQWPGSNASPASLPRSWLQTIYRNSLSIPAWPGPIFTSSECGTASDSRCIGDGPSSFSIAPGTSFSTTTNPAAHARPMKMTQRRMPTATNPTPLAGTGC